MKNISKYWGTLLPLTKGMFLFLAFNLVVNIFLIIGARATRLNLENLQQVTALYHTIGFFSFNSGDDSWMPMFKALEFYHTRHEHPNSASVYDSVFFSEGIRYQYPLTSLLPIGLIRIFLPESDTKNVLLLLSWAAILGTILISIKIFNLPTLSIGRARNPGSKSDLVTRNFLLLCFGLTFYPLLKAFTLGQIQVFLNFFFTLAVWFWLKGRSHISGFLIGLITLVKPQYIIIILWGIFRKKWSFSVAAAITIVAGLLVSILVFGFSENTSYLSVLNFISHRGQAAHANQSMNGLLNRLLFNFDDFKPNMQPSVNGYGFPAFNPIVYFGTVLSSFLLISWGFWGFIRSDNKGSIFDFLNISLVCTVASPVAWEHHYGILLAIYSILIPLALERLILGKHTVFYCAVLYFFAGNLLSFTVIFKKIFFLNILQSYLFFAVLGTLLALKIISKNSASPKILISHEQEALMDRRD